MVDQLRGIIPGNTNADFIYLTGAVLSWCARIEGMMVHDIFALRTWPFSRDIVIKEPFPKQGKPIAKHWRKLILNGYRHFGLEEPKLDDIVNNWIECLDHRNSLAHSFWPYGQNSQEVLELSWIRPNPKKPDGVEKGIYRISATDLDAVNSKLARLYNRVLAASFNSHILYRQNR